MTSFLQVENLTKSFGDKVLFEHISFGVLEGQRVALIAKNGYGKSSLLNIITGGLESDEGSITYRKDLRVGYLCQQPKIDPNLTVLEACGDSLASKQILTKLKISKLDQIIGTLSGGQLKRVALAQVLIQEPEFLILDEPTNHLDLEMIEWLEDYLRRTKLTLLMVTHDRYFLDRVCTEILEIDGCSLFAYHGNYSYYLDKRAQRIEAFNAETERYRNLYRTELDWMRRMPQARAHKAQYRIDNFYKIEERAKQQLVNDNVRLEVKSTYIGSKIFECKYVSKKYDDRIIVQDFYYNFARYEKLGIVGNNGTGKSTFLKLLLGIERPDSGSFDIGETVRFGYYRQEGLPFESGKKVIDLVRDVAEYIDLGGGKHLSAGQFLQHFLFSPQQQYDYVEKLSGGEKQRLHLCMVLMRNPNFLILDEPTNDLDIVTLNILEDYLRNFKGCLIVVSHDRFFMDKVVDHLLVFKEQGSIKDFPGNYTQYREYRDSTEVQKAQIEPKTNKNEERKQNMPERSSQSKKLSYKEQQELRTLEVEIPQLEEEKAQLEAQLSGALTRHEEIAKASARYEEVSALLDEKEMRWLELSE